MSDFLTVLKKELKEIFRDKRTVILSVLIPLFLFPGVSYFMTSNVFKLDNKSKIKIHTDNISRPYILPLVDSGKVELINHASMNDLTNGSLHLFLEKENESFIIKYNNVNPESVKAAQSIKIYLDQIGKENVETYESKIKLYPIKESTIARGYLLLSIVLPTLFFLFSVSASMATAADIVTGEKERLTIEILFSTPVSRTAMLAGKLCAVSVTGFIGLLSFLSGVYLSFILSPGLFAGGEISLIISLESALFLFISAVFLVLFSSIVEIFISLFARTIKEAQIYFIPYLLLNSAIGYSVISLNPYEVPLVKYMIPLHNLAVIIKQSAVNHVSWILASMVWIQMALYIVLFFCFSVVIMNKEKILFKK